MTSVSHQISWINNLELIMKTEHKKHLQDVYDINFSIYCLKKDSFLFFVFFFNDCVYKAIACMNYQGKYIIMPSLFIPFDSRIFFSNTFFYLNFLSKIVYRVRRIYPNTSEAQCILSGYLQCRFQWSCYDSFSTCVSPTNK